MAVRTGAEARRWAEAALRSAISRGDVVPGQRLIEDELAARFDVTRSSLRQAIDTLVSEGLVERVQNRGARVRQLSISDAVEITECRAVVEGLLARKAAERADANDADNLRTHIGLMRDSLFGGDLVKYSSRITELYGLIHSVARHENALELVQRLQAQLVRQQFRLSLRPGRPEQSLAELSHVVDAIVGHRPQEAEELMRDHLQRVAVILSEDSDAEPRHEPGH